MRYFPVWLGLLISAIVLSMVGIYNGYPLFYSDTNAYILSGMHLDTPTTRPITYGLFILLTSFGSISLWPVIIVQSLLIAFLIHCCFRYILKCGNSSLPTLLVSTLLALTTGISWVSSELIADIFTPISIISLILLISVKDLSKPDLWLLFLIFFVANATHISHMAISAVLLVIAVCSRKHFAIDRTQFFRRIGFSILLMVVGYFAMSSSVAKSRHIFLMAHLNEIGVLKSYLDEQCSIQDLKICKYKDEIPVDFIWNKERSPVYRSDIGWRESQPEFDRIIADVLTTPKYLWEIISVSFKWTLKQLISFRVGNGNNPFDAQSEMFATISTFFPNEAQTFLLSKQNKGTLLPVPILDTVHKVVMLCSVLILAVFLGFSKFRKHLPKELRIMTMMICISIIVNAAVCVSIVSVVDRFGCRVMWLLPMLVMLCLSCFRQSVKANELR